MSLTLLLRQHQFCVEYVQLDWAAHIYIHMELFLNAVWLLLSFSVLAWCVGRQRAANGSRSELVRALVAASLVALLIFPVISATDDLHMAQASVEEPTLKKIVAAVQGPTASAAPLALTVALLLALLLIIPEFFVAGFVAEESVAAIRRRFFERIKGRAPPACLSLC